MIAIRPESVKISQREIWKSLSEFDNDQPDGENFALDTVEDRFAFQPTYNQGKL